MPWGRMPEREAELRRTFAKQGYPSDLLAHMQYWANDDEELRAFVAREYAGGREQDPLRWHVSVMGQLGIPDWGQMAEAAHAIRPGVFFVVLVPPKSWWMNVHPNVLHLWETNDTAVIEEARANARGDRPTR